MLCECGYSKLHIHDWRKQTLVDLPFHGKIFKLVVSKQRYRCLDCGKRISSALSFAEKHKIITYRAIQYIITKLKKLNFKDTSLDLEISITTVIRYFHKEADFEVIDLKSPKVLHIDEFKGTSDARKYQVALCDVDTNKLYDVLTDRNQATLIEYFKKLTTKPEICVIDMWLPFKRAINRTWKDTVIVADKFHYVRQVQWAIKSIRIKAQECSKGNKKLKKYWKLFAKNTNNLTKNQIWRLEKLLSLDEDLKEAYYIKAYFDRYVLETKGKK